MKQILSIILLVSSLSAFAFEAEFEVQARKGKKLKTEVATLIHLKEVNKDEDKAFEGDFFKIVHNTDNDAIKFNNKNQLLKFRAATVYHHMTIARNYFSKLGLEYSNKDKKITVRVDVDKEYSNTVHFAYREDYNGAKTISASNEFSNTSKVKELYGGDGTWGNETWFFKAKEVKRSNPLQSAANYVDSRDFKNLLLGQLLYQDVLAISSQLVAEQGQFDGLTAKYHLYSMLFSIGLTEIIPKALKLFSRFVKQKHYLDTALIPEIIYHEYAHIALGDIFGFKSSRPLNEGYPNYFAHKISGLDILGAKAGKLSKGDMGKTSKSKSKYNFSIPESMAAAHGSFTFSLLKQTDDLLGIDGEKILVEVVSQMNNKTAIRSGYGLENYYKKYNEVVPSVFNKKCTSFVCILKETVRSNYANPDAKLLLIRGLLNKKGL
jgi:hypothetical protein